MALQDRDRNGYLVPARAVAGRYIPARDGAVTDDIIGSVAKGAIVKGITYNNETDADVVVKIGDSTVTIAAGSVDVEEIKELMVEETPIVVTSDATKGECTFFVEYFDYTQTDGVRNRTI